MKIYSFSGSFSVHGKRIILIINNEVHDISELFPEHSYSHEELNNPVINHEIRTKLCIIVRNYVYDLDQRFPISEIIC